MTGVTEVTCDSVTEQVLSPSHGVTVSPESPNPRGVLIMNHTQRVAHVARQRRYLTKAMVREAVERYLAALVDEIASGEWVDIPYLGKIQVVQEEGSGYVNAIVAGGTRAKRRVQMRLRTKVRLSEQFRRQRRS